jgi:SAM-dependent methyltransferase
MSIDRDKDDGEGNEAPQEGAQGDTRTDKKDDGLVIEAVSDITAESDAQRMFVKELLLSHRLSHEAIKRLTDLVKEGRVQFKFNLSNNNGDAPVPEASDPTSPKQLELPLDKILSSSRFSSIPCMLDPAGLDSIPPQPFDAYDEIGTGEISVIASEDVPNVVPSPGPEPVIDAGLTNNPTIAESEDSTAIDRYSNVVSGDLSPIEKDEFEHIRFLGDPKPLTKEELEERQMKMRIETAFSDEAPETRMLLKRVRNLLNTGEDVKVLKILEEELQFTARLRYDNEHRQKTHEFSEATDDSTEYSKFFIREAHIGRTSKVLELGSGFLRDTIAFAKEGARVTAVDASAYAIESGNRFIAGKPYADRITTLNDDFIEFLYSVAPGSFTHIYLCSSGHYRPSTIVMRDFRHAHTILSPNNGYLCIAMKTNESESKTKQVPLTMDRYHCGVDPRDKIFRIYPEKLAVDEMVRGAGFTIMEAFTSRMNGYDVKDEVEVFRVILAQANKEKVKITR